MKRMAAIGPPTKIRWGMASTMRKAVVVRLRSRISGSTRIREGYGGGASTSASAEALVGAPWKRPPWGRSAGKPGDKPSPGGSFRPHTPLPQWMSTEVEALPAWLGPAGVGPLVSGTAFPFLELPGGLAAKAEWALKTWGGYGSPLGERSPWG